MMNIMTYLMGFINQQISRWPRILCSRPFHPGYTVGFGSLDPWTQPTDFSFRSGGPYRSQQV